VSGHAKNNWQDKTLDAHNTHNLKAGANAFRQKKSSRMRRRRANLQDKQIVERMQRESELRNLELRRDGTESGLEGNSSRRRVPSQVPVSQRSKSIIQSQYPNRFMALSCGLRKWQLHQSCEPDDELQRSREPGVDTD
jgi:hypothetical protein